MIIGTWIDGKPVYQKTFTGLNASIDASSWRVLCTIQNIKLVINLVMFYDNASSTTDINTLFPKEIEPYTNGDVKVLAQSGRTVTSATIQYTKTTD